MTKVKVPYRIKRAFEFPHETNFTCEIIRLCGRADPLNLAALKKSFPLEVTAWESWYKSDPEKIPEEVEIEDPHLDI